MIDIATLLPLANLAGLFLSLLAYFIAYGRLLQKVDVATTRLDAHEALISGIDSAQVSATGAVVKLGGDIQSLSERLDARQLLSSSEMARVADSVRAGQELIAVRLEGLEKLERGELTQVKHDINNIRQSIVSLGQIIRERPD